MNAVDFVVIVVAVVMREESGEVGVVVEDKVCVALGQRKVKLAGQVALNPVLALVPTSVNGEVGEFVTNVHPRALEFKGVDFVALNHVLVLQEVFGAVGEVVLGKEIVPLVPKHTLGVEIVVH
jgi:hypothetical protein